MLFLMPLLLLLVDHVLVYFDYFFELLIVLLPHSIYVFLSLLYHWIQIIR